MPINARLPLGTHPTKYPITDLALDVYSASTTAIGTFTVPNDAAGDVVFNIKTLSGETIAVTTSNDGTNFISPAYVTVSSTGLPTAAATVGSTGEYRLEMMKVGSPKYVKFVKSAGTNPCVIAVACSGTVSPYQGVQS